ncbi:preprotein translocase subunit SecA [Patescibacteria group bacterium]|nr:preprotein translocase subunit SecA [Patescibacteria group bacterium]MBU4161996.1 preprotein translocase subunit SecA [Patescibacteria group bacterium]
MSILKAIFGDDNEKYLKRLRPLVEKINNLESEFKRFSDEELKNKSSEFKERIQKNNSLDDTLPEAFALVRETAKRVLKQRHFDVQLMGGIVLHQGGIAEMKTGEGKTLASTLPAVLNALSGKGVHIVTVNDYLAKRDAVWMGQIYYALGLSTACLVHDSALIYDPEYETQDPKSKNEEDQDRDEERDVVGGFKVVESYLRPVSRKEAYQADIVYGTNHEFGFDYLRDSMAQVPEQRAQRGQNFAIIDEVDSVLIDEARTPLIISAPDVESSKLYEGFSRIIPRLKENEDYEIHEKEKAATLTDVGVTKIEKILGIGNIYEEKGTKYLHHLEQALRAEVVFKKDKDYVVKDGGIIIVDEFTGRMMPGRRWSGGLHQAVEAKEGLSVQSESLTLASISLQNYFRMYKKLAGMTGTAITSAEEFEKVYKLDVVAIPTNNPMVRQDLADVIYKTEKEKFLAIAEKIKECHQKGQPVLIGTRSIEKNEMLGRILETKGVAHEILNAKHHQREGEIIAQAGRKGAVTVATNMAGRGVDIVLGGNPPDVQGAEEIKKLGGLLVLGTERHEARRIDNQLRGRSGRQGDPGVSQFFLSAEDDLLRIFGGDRIKGLMERLRVPEGQPIQSKLISQAVESAQAKIEGMNFDARKHLLEYDDVMNVHRTSFYKKRNEIVDATDEKLKANVSAIFEKQGEPKDDFLKKETELGSEFSRALRFVCLRMFDAFWIEHLTEMDYLRDKVRLRAYGQLDPLVEYKNEGYKMFKQLFNLIETNIIKGVLNISLTQQAQQTQQTQQQNLANNNSVLANSGDKAGRNDPCPCGEIDPATGKVYKYKKCCGK